MSLRCSSNRRLVERQVKRYEFTSERYGLSMSVDSDLFSNIEDSRAMKMQLMLAARTNEIGNERMKEGARGGDREED